MNWVKFRRLIYLPMLAAGTVLAIALVIAFRSQPLTPILIAVVVFVPGQIARTLLKVLFA